MPTKTHSAAVPITWDDRNLRHLREGRRCRVPDVEQVIRATCHTSRRRRLLVQAGQRAKWKYFGETCAGRPLVVIAEETASGIRPITCWPLVGKERARYLAWRETRKTAR